MRKDREKPVLVPEAEQPYPIPDNWRWLHGFSVFSAMESKKPSGKTFRYIDIDSVDNKRQAVTAPKVLAVKDAPSRASRALQTGDTLFSMVRPYLKNIAFIDESICDAIASTGFYVCRPKIVVNSRFVYYLMVSPYVVDGLNTFMKGDNSPSIRSKDIECYHFPVPPLPEQLRIVEHIESLFSKLDEAKEKAQKYVDKYEARRAAILYLAFTGELTAEWRNREQVNFEDWTTATLQSVCAMKITDGTHKTPTYCDKDKGFAFISAKDVTSGSISWDNIKYIIPELHEDLYARLAPQIDDVLLAKNGTTGVAAIVDTDRVFDLYVTLAVLRPNKTIIIPRYLLNVVNSPICKQQFDEHLTGIGVPNLHLRDIKAVEIPLPPMQEQEEIVRVLDLLLYKEQQVKNLAESVINRIEVMKKAVLASAFRGELGTNDPSEPPVDIPALQEESS